MDLMPEYDYLYLGDNARNPYGNHGEENIKLFTEQAVNYLFSKKAKLIILGCNTASSVALRYLQKKYLKGDKETERKILGVLIPMAEEAVKITKNKRIGVVGTKATIRSGNYEKEIKKLNPKISVHSLACPLLVPLIEENWHKKPEAKMILKKYLNRIKSCNIDVLILGCTHYPLMIGDFKRYMGKRIKVLSSGEITAVKLKEYLGRHPEIEKKLSKKGKREFLTTDDPKVFQNFVQEHFGMKIKTPKQINLTPTQS